MVLHLSGDFVRPRAGAVAFREHGPAPRSIAAFVGALWLRTDGPPHGSRQRREVVGAGAVEDGGPGATLLNKGRLPEFGELGGYTGLRHARDLDELSHSNFSVVEQPQQTNSCDCGVYTLRYGQEFLARAVCRGARLAVDGRDVSLCFRDHDFEAWFTGRDIAEMRRDIKKFTDAASLPFQLIGSDHRPVGCRLRFAVRLARPRADPGRGEPLVGGCGVRAPPPLPVRRISIAASSGGSAGMSGSAASGDSERRSRKPVSTGRPRASPISVLLISPSVHRNRS